MSIQLIERVNGEEQLREKEGQWAYRLNTLDPHGLNDNDFFFLFFFLRKTTKRFSLKKHVSTATSETILIILTLSRFHLHCCY